MTKFRARTFCLILYDEDETHTKAIKKIKQSYDYAMICHDRDTDDKGEVLKAHYHVVLKFSNAKWNTALAEELGITENYIEEARNIKRALLYLIHFYDEDKFQYTTEDVTGPLKKKLVEYLRSEGKTESEKVLEILEEIENTDHEITYFAFCKHCASIGYYDVIRRSSSLITKVIDEHNRKLLK